MREIKFRAYHPDGTMVYFNTKDHYQLEHLGALMRGDHPDGGVLMQFTGLKDVHGVEIWEGDIVKHKIIFTPKYQLMKVMFLEGSFACNPLSGKNKNRCELLSDMKVSNEPFCRLEVIGNRFENPELLEEK